MLSTALMLAALAAAPDTDPQAILDRGDLAAREGRWLDAAAAYEEVYDATGDVRVRFGQAEALRYGGDCKAALPLYEECLGDDASPSLRTLAQGRISLCSQAVQTAETRRPVKAPPPAETAAAPVVDPPQTLEGPRWYRDPLGDGLVAVGLAASIAGGVVLGLGRRAGNDPDTSTDRAFGDSLQRGETMTLAGGLTFGAGAALTLGGVVRWIVVGRRDRTLDVSLRRGGLQVSGRLPSLSALTP